MIIQEYLDKKAENNFYSKVNDWVVFVDQDNFNTLLSILRSATFSGGEGPYKLSKPVTGYYYETSFGTFIIKIK